MRFFGYARVSTQDQAQHGHSLADQRTQIEAYCAFKGWELVTVYSDEGATAKHLDRPALQCVLGRLAANEADGLIVAKLDRLSRSIIDFGTLLDWFKQADKALVALDFEIDTSTPNGRLVANVMMSVAEWERETLSERTRNGLRQAKASGVELGGPNVSAEARRLIEDYRRRGYSLGEICEVLEYEGIPTARGGKWSPSTIQGVLGYKPPAKPRSTSRLPELA